MSDIFLSYAREDEALAERLALALEKQNWSVWWDRSIPAGRTFDEVIEEAIGATGCIIVLWSERSVASRWVRTEAEEGAKRGILVPIRIEDVEIPLAFRSIQAADLIGWDGRPGAPGFDALVVDIAAVVDRVKREEGQDGRQREAPEKRLAEIDEGRPAGLASARKDGAEKRRWQQDLLWAIAAIVLGIGILGLIVQLRSGHPGWNGTLDNDRFVVTRVFEGGGAERAGIQEGDVITGLDGTALPEWWALSQSPGVGDTHVLSIERAGQSLEVDLTFEGLPPRLSLLVVLFFALALVILASCLWAYLEMPSATSRCLALFGLSFCLAFLQFPAEGGAQRLWGSLLPPLIVLGFAFLVHFLLLFPKHRPLLDKSWGLKLVYFPAVVVAVVFVANHFLEIGLDRLIYPFAMGYLALAAVLVIHSYKTATRQVRTEQGLGLMLGGVILGLLPPLAWLLAKVYPIDLAMVLPLVDFYPLTLGLIPITFSFAAVRGQKTTVAA